MIFGYRTFLALGFAYAASSIGPAAAATADDPCKISKTVVGAAMGLPVISVRPRSVGGLAACAFRTATLLHYASISTSPIAKAVMPTVKP